MKSLLVNDIVIKDNKAYFSGVIVETNNSYTIEILMYEFAKSFYDVNLFSMLDKVLTLKEYKGEITEAFLHPHMIPDSELYCTFSDNDYLHPYITYDSGDVTLDNYEVFKDRFDEDVLKWFGVDDIRKVGKKDIINFINTIENRCMVCFHLLTEDEFMNNYGGMYEPPHCEGYCCHECGHVEKY